MIYSALSCLLGKQKPGLFKKSIRPVFIAEKNDAALIAVRRRIQPALSSCAAMISLSCSNTFGLNQSFCTSASNVYCFCPHSNVTCRVPVPFSQSTLSIFSVTFSKSSAPPPIILTPFRKSVYICSTRNTSISKAYTLSLSGVPFSQVFIVLSASKNDKQYRRFVHQNFRLHVRITSFISSSSSSVIPLMPSVFKLLPISAKLSWFPHSKSYVDISVFSSRVQAVSSGKTARTAGAAKKPGQYRSVLHLIIPFPVKRRPAKRGG